MRAITVDRLLHRRRGRAAVWLAVVAGLCAGSDSPKAATYDMMIAAHALSLGLVVVTDNEREFRHVKSLPVENWRDRQDDIEGRPTCSM